MQGVIFMIAAASNNQLRRLLAALCTLAVLTGLLGRSSGPLLPPEPATRLPAVVIRTQEAADSIPGGIRGIDVSLYQGRIDWPAVARDNVRFAIIRASVGMKADEYFVSNVAGAVNAGLKVGAYHYAKFSDEDSMAEEADFFLKQLEGKSFSYPVFLDIEDNSANRALSKSELTALCVRFLERVGARGYPVMLYSGTNFLRSRLDTAKLSGYGLWEANYIEEPASDRVMWQHTSYGNVSGIQGRVCVNIAYADLSAAKKRTVNRAISDSIKATLNERHGAGLPEEGIDLVRIKAAVVTALQSELNRQLDAALTVTGEMDAATLSALERVPFTYGETKGNITYLMQVMLFYNGYFTEPLTGAYDSHTVTALKAFQTSLGQTAGGTPDRETLWYLFR